MAAIMAFLKAMSEAVELKICAMLTPEIGCFFGGGGRGRRRVRRGVGDGRNRWTQP
jgi:hypothetical protein